MGKASRDKGKRGERELVPLWAAALPGVAVRRTGQDQAHQAVEKPADIATGGLYAVEAKRRKRMSWTTIREGVEQACEAASVGAYPVCCHREDRGSWYVTMRLDDYLELVQEHYERGMR